VDLGRGYAPPEIRVQGYAEAIDYAESQNGEYLLRTRDDGDEIVTLANPVRLNGYPGDSPRLTIARPCGC
jgi:hypothetical protein